MHAQLEFLILPKIDKELDYLQPFRPMIETNDTVHYSTATLFAKLLKPLTTNEFCLDDSFDVAGNIKSIYK